MKSARASWFSAGGLTGISRSTRTASTHRRGATTPPMPTVGFSVLFTDPSSATRCRSVPLHDCRLAGLAVAELGVKIVLDDQAVHAPGPVQQRRPPVRCEHAAGRHLPRRADAYRTQTRVLLKLTDHEAVVVHRQAHQFQACGPGGLPEPRGAGVLDADRHLAVREQGVRDLGHALARAGEHRDRGRLRGRAPAPVEALGKYYPQPRMPTRLGVVQLIERRGLGGRPDGLDPFAARKSPEVGAGGGQIEPRLPAPWTGSGGRTGSPAASSRSGRGVQLTRVAEPVRAVRYPSVTSCAYAWVTVQRETPRSAASVRLGGRAASRGIRPSLMAVRIAAVSRMCSGPGLVAGKSSRVSQARLVCIRVTPLDRRGQRIAPSVMKKPAYV